MNSQQNKRVRYNNELLQTLCKTNCIILVNDYSHKNINRNSVIEGKCTTENCNENFKKTFRVVYKMKGQSTLCMSQIIHLIILRKYNICLNLYILGRIKSRASVKMGFRDFTDTINTFDKSR